MPYKYSDLQCSNHDGILVIELNRPDKRNAMRLELRQQLVEALEVSEADDRVDAVVVTGAGDRAFSSGADLNELRQRTLASEMARPALLRRQLPMVAETFSKPMIAAVNGACIGAGLEFALACPIRFASENATFGLPEVRLGVVPGSGGTQRLGRVVGLGWAMHLILSGDTIDAATAERINLVTAVFAPSALLGGAIEMARRLARSPGLGYLAARDAVIRAFDVDQATGIDFERKLFALCLSTGVPAEQAGMLLERITGGSAGNRESPGADV